MTSAYLDYQSSTPVLPEVWEAMRPFGTECFATPSALHQQGLRARDALAQARDRVAAFIGAENPEEIIFTSGATESANLAVFGTSRAAKSRGSHVVLSALEHPSVLRAVERLEEDGFCAVRVASDAAGRVDAAAVEEAMTERTILVCLHLANHDLGTIQPIQAVAAAAARRGVPLFVDASAAGGWMPIDVASLGADLLSLAPHRFYGPKGVGVLYRNRRARLRPLLVGGRQEGGLRAGTENVAAIVGAGVAAHMAGQQMDERRRRVGMLQVRLWQGLRARVTHVCLHGPEPGPERLPTNLNVSVEFVEGEGLALMCDVQGIAVASGASCVSKALKGSPVLAAIGVDRTLAMANVMLSLGKDNTDGEIDYFLKTFPNIVAKLRAMSPAWDEFQSGRLEAITPEVPGG